MDQQNTQPPEIPAEIQQFLNGLIAEAQIPTLSESDKAGLINELYLSLDDYLATAILDNLPPEKIDEFIKMNEDGKTKAEVEQFLQTNMPDAQEVFAQALAQFRQNYLGGALNSESTGS